MEKTGFINLDEICVILKLSSEMGLKTPMKHDQASRTLGHFIKDNLMSMLFMLILNEKMTMFM